MTMNQMTQITQKLKITQDTIRILDIIIIIQEIKVIEREKDIIIDYTRKKNDIYNKYLQHRKLILLDY